MVEEGRRSVIEQEKKDDIMRVDHEQLAQRELPSLLKLRRGSLVQDCGTLPWTLDCSIPKVSAVDWWATMEGVTNPVPCDSTPLEVSVMAHSNWALMLIGCSTNLWTWTLAFVAKFRNLYSSVPRDSFVLYMYTFVFHVCTSLVILVGFVNKPLTFDLYRVKYTLHVEDTYHIAIWNHGQKPLQEARPIARNVYCVRFVPTAEILQIAYT